MPITPCSALPPGLTAQRRATAWALALGLSAAGSGALAQTTVADAWVRATVPQQRTTGLYVNLTSAKGGKLVSASSTVAEAVEIHEMKMDGQIMRMRQLPELALPAGQTVQLKPGGYHIMLINLKRPLAVGEAVPVTLVIENTAGPKETLEVRAAVRSQAADPTKTDGKPAAAHPHGHTHGHKH